MKSTFKLFIISAVLFMACNQEKTAEETVEILVDATAAEILENIDSYKGEKAVLVNAWATWCIPCVEEFPYIMDLKKKYNDDLEIVFISTDFPEAKEEALGFLNEQGVSFTTYYKTEKDNDFIMAMSDEWTGALPFTMIIARDGTRLSSWEGKQEYDFFEERVLEAIQ